MCKTLEQQTSTDTDIYGDGMAAARSAMCIVDVEMYIGLQFMAALMEQKAFTSPLDIHTQPNRRQLRQEIVI